MLTSGARVRVKIDGRKVKQSDEKNGTRFFVLPVSDDSHEVMISLKHNNRKGIAG